MSSKITISSLDSDAAVQEAAEAAGFDTRSDFFRKSIYAGGSLVAGGVLMGGMPALASAAPSRKQDIAILNFALTLEFLEDEFYRLAISNNALSGPALDLTKVISTHEKTHVSFLKKAVGSLGGKAVKKPKFDFKDTVTDQAKFLETAFVLENTGVKAYLGQAARIKSRAILKAAGSILTIEARHSGAIAQLTGKPVSPSGSFDKPKSMSQILTAVKGTGFIVG